MTNKIEKPDINPDILLRLAEKFPTIAECNKWVASKTSVSITTASIWRVKDTRRPIPRLKLKELIDAIRKEFPSLEV
jgi:hypothetical protein